MARRTIEHFIPKAGTVDEEGLRTIEPEILAKYVTRSKNPWWRRRPCVRALRDRVPDAYVEPLFSRVSDPDDTSEVKIALLEVLPLRESWLPWLRDQGDAPYGMGDAILKARAALGDLTVTAQVATLANNLWTHSRQTGEAALDALIARYGIDAIESQLGTDRVEDRVFHARMLARRGGDVLATFADPDIKVATVACELAITNPAILDEALLDYVATGPTIHARLWAAYALHRRGRDITDLWDAMDRPRIEIAGLPDDIRRAILREYEGTTPTDPHWFVERICEPLPTPNVDAQLARATAALEAAGLAPQRAVPIGEINGQGGGSYHVIELANAASISISTLGPFVTGDDHQPLARRVLMAAGFTWLEPDVASIIVEGLAVYYFGSRKPLDVGTLLFYWQD